MKPTVTNKTTPTKKYIQPLRYVQQAQQALSIAAAAAAATATAHNKLNTTSTVSATTLHTDKQVTATVRQSQVSRIRQPPPHQASVTSLIEDTPEPVCLRDQRTLLDAEAEQSAEYDPSVSLDQSHADIFIDQLESDSEIEITMETSSDADSDISHEKEVAHMNPYIF